MTHEYRILVEGNVIRGAGEPDATAIAWAGGTILALGTDEEVRAISRGDSDFTSLDGAFVASVAREGSGRWEPEGVLEVGATATFGIFTRDPRSASSGRGASGPPGAVVRDGSVVKGRLPLGGGRRMGR